MLPNVPTAQEAGVPGYQLSIWTGVFAPHGTAKDVVAKLNSAIEVALTIDDATAHSGARRHRRAENERSSAYLGDLVRKETVRWDPILRKAAAAAPDREASVPMKK